MLSVGVSYLHHNSYRRSLNIQYNDDILTLPFSSHFTISLGPPLHSHLPDETLWYQVGQGASSPERVGKAAAVTRTIEIKNLIFIIGHFKFPIKIRTLRIKK